MRPRSPRSVFRAPWSSCATIMAATMPKRAWSWRTSRWVRVPCSAWSWNFRSSMHLLVTGAAGFVMSVLGREWLAAHSDARLTVLDVAPLDEAAHLYFAPVAQRLDVIVADLTRPESW